MLTNEFKFLIRFLKEYDIYAQFKRNIPKETFSYWAEKDMVKYFLPSEYLRTAFTWEETNEGYDYWLNIYKHLKLIEKETTF